MKPVPHMSDTPPPKRPMMTCPRCRGIAVEALGTGYSSDWFMCRSCGNVWSEKRLTQPE
jgi:transposase-like protein